MSREDDFFASKSVVKMLYKFRKYREEATEKNAKCLETGIASNERQQVAAARKAGRYKAVLEYLLIESPQWAD